MKSISLFFFCAFICNSLLVSSVVLANDYKELGGEKSVVGGNKQIPKESDDDGAWLVVPIPFANPTIGVGLQAAVLYMHDQKEEDTPGATTGLGGMYADSESYLIGLFHDDYFAADKFRMTVAYALAELNMDYYGSGGNNPFEEDPVSYTITGNGLYGKFLYRLPGSEGWYLGLQYMGTSSKVKFDLTDLHQDLPVLEGDVLTSGLGLLLSYDSRDNNYYAESGQYLTAGYSVDNEKFGSDFDFVRSDVSYQYYLPMVEDHIMVFKAETKRASENTPFYMEPTLSMRGFDTSKYRDLTTLSLHAEWRYKFATRWGMVVFVEGGVTGDDYNQLGDNQDVQSGGVGLRWKATKTKKINLSIDFATSSNGDQATYLRAGEAF